MESDKMPRLNPETENSRALKTTTDYINAGLNQSALARKRGVNRRVINRQVNKPKVQRSLAEHFKKIGITATYKVKKFKQLLETDEKFVQLGTLKLLCQVQGDIKTNGKGGTTAVIIRIGNSDRIFTPAETKLISSQLREV